MENHQVETYPALLPEESRELEPNYAYGQGLGHTQDHWRQRQFLGLPFFGGLAGGLLGSYLAAPFLYGGGYGGYYPYYSNYPYYGGYGYGYGYGYPYYRPRPYSPFWY